VARSATGRARSGVRTQVLPRPTQPGDVLTAKKMPYKHRFGRSQRDLPSADGPPVPLADAELRREAFEHSCPTCNPRGRAEHAAVLIERSRAKRLSTPAVYPLARVAEW